MSSEAIKFRSSDGVERRVSADAPLPVSETVDGGFATGKSFRTFLDLNIAASGTQVVQVVSTDDVLFKELGLALVSGALKIETLAGGTPGGSFSTLLPRLRTNNLSSAPATTATTEIKTGGTQTGGVALDVTYISTLAGIGSSTPVGGAGDARGILPGTYYFKLTNLSGDEAAVGTFKAVWTEL